MKLRKCMCAAALAGLVVLTNTFPAAAEGNQDSKTVNSAEIVPAMAGFQIDLSGFLEGSYDQMDYITISGTRHYDAAYEVLAIVNKERAKVGLSPLTMDQDLLEAAMKRAAESCVDFSHTRPNQTMCSSASSKMNGENIAAGSRTAEGIMTIWMNSPGHRANILTDDYQSIGVGCFEQGDTWYWVQAFGSGEAETGTQPQNRSVTELIPYVYDEYSSQFGLSVSGDEEDDTLYTGNKLPLQVVMVNKGWQYAYAKLNADSFAWTSSNASVATVNEQGIVTGLAAGDTTITASSEKITVSRTIHVKKKAGSSKNTTGNTSMSTVRLQVKQKISAFKVMDIPNGDYVKSYKSGNTRIFTVNQAGKLTAKKAGTAKLTATLASGKKITVKVIVQKGKVKTTKVTVNKKSLKLKAGKTETLKVKRYPYTSQEKVTYKSSNSKVVKVSKNGKVTAKKKGSAKITVKSGKKTVTCKVKVY